MQTLLAYWNRLPLRQKLTYLLMVLATISFLLSALFFIGATNRQRNDVLFATLNNEHNILFENLEASTQTLESLSSLAVGVLAQGNATLVTYQRTFETILEDENLDWIALYNQGAPTPQLAFGTIVPLDTLNITWLVTESVATQGEVRTGFAVTAEGLYVVSRAVYTSAPNATPTTITMGRFFDVEAAGQIGLNPASHLAFISPNGILNTLGIPDAQLLALIPAEGQGIIETNLAIAGRPYRILLKPLVLEGIYLGYVGITVTLTGGVESSSVDLSIGLGTILISFLVLLLTSTWFIENLVVRDLNIMATSVQSFATQERSPSTHAITDLVATFRTTREDEIGLLAGAFTNLLAELRHSYEDLEAKVEARTRSLSASAEVARVASATLDLDTLLHQTVTLICNRFSFYHASIFLVEPGSNVAVIRAASSEPGKTLKFLNHQLAIGSTSLVGKATFSRSPVVVQDVAHEPTHYKNPLLPDTRAEAVFPMIAGDEVVGVLDVQSLYINSFTGDMIALLSTLADQIAVAVQKARLFNETVALYEEQKAVSQQLAEADRLKSEFIANMSHELRTPLNSIIGFSRVILKGIDGPINDTQRKDLTIIYDAGRHLLDLINNILDLSKIEANKIQLYWEPVKLPDVIQEALATTAVMIREKGLTLVEEIEPNLPVLHADPLRVRQVLLNLLSNAVKFTDSGTVRISARHDTLLDPQLRIPQAAITVSVKDTGIGIASEDLPKLFKNFAQLDSSPTRRFGGSGLGLTIARHLVELHGGTIKVESDVHHGSTFTFTLPITPPPNLDEIATRESAFV